jgi:hypothetical protein
MAYSMLECPKLHNTKSLKFYPEEYDHHVSFRHKNLPPDFELTVENYAEHNKSKYTKEEKKNYSVQAKTSAHKKCPIYIHNFNEANQNDGDSVLKNRKKSKNKQKSVIEKLEETYWANWKPDKYDTKKSNSPEIQVIKSAPGRRRKIKVYPETTVEEILDPTSQVEMKSKMKTISSKSEEIQTDDLSIPPKTEEDNTADSIEESPQVEETFPDEKFLKHTDSFVLNVKKQKEEKEHFDQPKCIRLYKKPGKMSSKNFIKGGSYPLKSCLKKEGNLTKGSSRLTRPGSPIIVSSNYTKGKYGKSHRH